MMKLAKDKKGASPAAFAAEVTQRSGVNPALCYQCGKCTAGCPMTFAMDIEPSRVMRLVQLGQRETLLNSHTIWLCASCETCTTRCPQEVDLAHVMDALRILAREAGHTGAERNAATMNEIFLNSIRNRGRVHETFLAMEQKLRTMALRQDMDKGPLLMLKGKMGLKGHKARNLDEVQRLFANVAKLRQEAGAKSEQEESQE